MLAIQVAVFRRFVVGLKRWRKNKKKSGESEVKIARANQFFYPDLEFERFACSDAGVRVPYGFYARTRKRRLISSRVETQHWWCAPAHIRKITTQFMAAIINSNNNNCWIMFAISRWLTLAIFGIMGFATPKIPRTYSLFRKYFQLADSINYGRCAEEKKTDHFTHSDCIGITWFSNYVDTSRRVSALGVGVAIFSWDVFGIVRNALKPLIKKILVILVFPNIPWFI